MSFDMVVFIVGLVLGCFMIIVVTVVYAKKQKFGTGGTVLTLVGFALIGLFVFSRIRIVITGIAEIEAELTKAQQAIQDVQKQKDASESALKELSSALENMPANGMPAHQLQAVQSRLQQRVNLILLSNQQIGRSLEIARNNTNSASEKFRRFIRPTR